MTPKERLEVCKACPYFIDGIAKVTGSAPWNQQTLVRVRCSASGNPEHLTRPPQVGTVLDCKRHKRAVNRNQRTRERERSARRSLSLA